MDEQFEFAYGAAPADVVKELVPIEAYGGNNDPPLTGDSVMSLEPLTASEVDMEGMQSEQDEQDLAQDITAKLVDQELGRAGRFRPTPKAAIGAATAALEASMTPPDPRPTRLQGAIGGGEDPFCQDNRWRGVDGQMPCSFEDLPAFQYLAELEEAVSSGNAFAEGRLPALPKALQGASAPVRGSVGAELPRSARGAGTSTLRACGGLLAKAPAGMSSSGARGFFCEDGWGIQAPLRPGARKHAAHSSLGFESSALRGAPLSHCRRGPAATALWVSSERERLQAEAMKPFGSSAAIAFLQNGGPQTMERLDRQLVNQELLA